MLHKLKIIENYADRIISGEKTFEVRYNDRDYQKGDIIQFIPVNSDLRQMHHEIADKLYEIIYIHTDLGMANRYVILGIKERLKDGEYKNSKQGVKMENKQKHIKIMIKMLKKYLKNEWKNDGLITEFTVRCRTYKGKYYSGHLNRRYNQEVEE